MFKNKKIIVGILGGAFAGTVTGVLLGPRSGRQTQHILATKILQPDNCERGTSPQEEESSSEDVLNTRWESSSCPHFPCC